MKSRTIRLAALTFLVVGALLLAGCGPKTATLAAELTDFKFTPDAWEVPAGAEVTLTLTNNGTQDHEWVIINLGDAVTIPFDDDDEAKVFWEGEAGPGETETFTFTAPTEAGDYTIVCGTPAHLEQGMQGILRVTP